MRYVLLVVCLFMVAGLSGCETMKGLGKDMETLGEKILGKSEDKQR
ncbi:MAG TPA: entericidin [Thioalkalivibrio sp.]|nr:entericidin [Thioalkalivibrio sp.]